MLNSLSIQEKTIGSVYIQTYSFKCCVFCTPLMQNNFLKTSLKDFSDFVNKFHRAQFLIYSRKNHRKCIYTRLLVWMLCLLYNIDANNFLKTSFKDLSYLVKKSIVLKSFPMQVKTIEIVYKKDYSLGCCVCCTPLMYNNFLKTSFKELMAN